MSRHRVATQSQQHPDGQAATHPTGHLPLTGLSVPLVTCESSVASSASLPRVSRGVTRQTSPTATPSPGSPPQVGQRPCTTDRPGNETVTPVSPAPCAHPHAHADPSSTNVLRDPALHMMQLERNTFLWELQQALTHTVKPA